MVETVCRCAHTQPSLSQPCKLLREDAPRWKAKVRSGDAHQVDQVQTACQRILKGVTDAYGCKPGEGMARPRPAR